MLTTEAENPFGSRGEVDIARLNGDGREGRPLTALLSDSRAAFEIGRDAESLDIPVVMSGVHYSHLANDLSVLARWPKLLLDTSRLAHLRAIEVLVGEIGAQRLLYATAPGGCPSSSLFSIIHAAISDEDKQLILRGNAARVFGVEDAPVDLTPPALPQRIFDVHCHIDPDPSWSWSAPQPGGLGTLLASYGIQQSVASSILAITWDLEEGNAHIVDECSKTGQLGYLVADPNDLSRTRIVLDRWSKSFGIVGVKVHSQIARQPTDSEVMRELFRLLASYGLPVKIHNDGDRWSGGLKRIIMDNPDLPIIIAHGGPGWPTVEAAELAANSDNVYWEMSSSYAQLAEARAAVQLGHDRLMFGSDAPLLDPAFVFGTYMDAGVEIDDHGVFWGNASHLFEPVG